jgi:hypothetical protein
MIEILSDATGGETTIACSGVGSEPDRVLSFHLVNGSPDFGPIPVGGSSECGFELRNEGRDPVVLTGISVPDEFHAALANDPVLPITIHPGQQWNLVLTFQPETIGLHAGTMVALSDATGGATSVACSGTGTGAAVVLTGDLAFGGVRIGESVERVLSITNSGNSLLMVSGISCPEGFSGYWSGSIAPGGSQDVAIGFSPQSKGDYTGEIVVEANHVAGTNTIACSGVGLQIYVRVRLVTGGEVVLGETGTVVLEIRSLGNAPVTVTGLLIEDYPGFPSGFSGDWSGVIPPGESAFVDLAFTPLDLGQHAAEVTVLCEYDRGPNTDDIWGFGIAPPGETAIAVWGSTQFGDVVVGDSVQRYIAFGNAGSAPIQVTGIEYPEGITGDQWSGILDVGVNQAVLMTFSPTTAGPYSGRIVVQSDAAYGSGSIDCSGTGIDRSRVIDLPRSWDFGGVVVESQSSQAMAIRNLGDTAMNVTGINYAPGFSGENWSGVLDPGGSHELLVTFSPDSAGEHSGDLVVHCDATYGSTIVQCSGVGLAQTRIVQLSGDLELGEIVAGSEAFRTLTMSNVGNAPLSITGIEYPVGFSGESWVGSIDPGASHEVIVTFSPDSAGVYSGAVVVHCDATYGSTIVPCAGLGLTQTRIIQLSGDLDFGEIVSENEASRTLTIGNVGNAPLSISEIEYPVGFSDESWVGSIDPGASHEVIVTFSPDSAGVYSGAVVLHCDATYGPTIVSCAGLGLAQTRIIQLSGDLDFGEIVAGSEAIKSLTIGNVGNASLSITGIGYPVGFSGGNWSGVLDPGGSHELLVTFSPDSAWEHSGDLVVHCDATYGSTNVQCSGVGLSQTRIIQLSGDLDFGEIVAGTEASKTLTIGNVGNAPLTITGIDYPVGFSGENWSGVVASGGSQELLVMFLPDSEGTYPGDLVVHCDATEGTSNIVCTGVGVLEGYWFWLVRHGLIPLGTGAERTDPDGDGCINLLEFFRGTSPLLVDPDPVLEPLAAGGDAAFRIRYWRSTTARVEGSRFEWSPDLVNWRGDGEAFGATTVSFSETEIGNRPGADHFELVPEVSGNDSSVFVRLVIDENEHGTLPEGLMAYWPLNGAANDPYGNYNAIAATARLNSPGFIGQGALFDADQYIDFGDVEAFELNDHSFFAWIKLDRLNVTQSVFCLQFSGSGITKAGLVLKITSSNSLELQQAQSDGGDWLMVTSDIDLISAGEWYHVGYVKDGGDVKIYLNGSQVANGTTKADLWIGSGTHHTGLGAGWKDWNDSYDMFWFRGKIDEAAFWGRPLSPSEVIDVYMFSP